MLVQAGQIYEVSGQSGQGHLQLTSGTFCSAGSRSQREGLYKPQLRGEKISKSPQHSSVFSGQHEQPWLNPSFVLTMKQPIWNIKYTSACVPIKLLPTALWSGHNKRYYSQVLSFTVNNTTLKAYFSSTTDVLYFSDGFAIQSHE